MTVQAENSSIAPTFMYGTAWKKEATAKLVQQAVEAGFKAIDTANQFIHYQEKLVGDALLSLQQKGVNRESLYLQTKFTSVGGQGRSPEIPYDTGAPLALQVKQSMDSSLIHLHTDYLDSYLLHGPYSRNGLGSQDWEVWTAIEELQKAGKTRSIGISNVTAEQLTQLCSKATIKPLFVQNRCYAVQGWDAEVREICRTHNIVYQGFSLLTANPDVLTSQVVRTAASRLKVAPAQIIFRFAMQVGMLPLTGTTNPQHMKEDLLAHSIELTPGEVEQIEKVALSGSYF
jgi:diketogulonate reductase-like aldo/keto reductase